MSASEGSTVTYMCRVCPGSLGWLVYYADNVTQVNNWNDYAIRAKTLPITSEGTQSSELSITVGKVDLTVLCYAGSKTVNETGKLSVQQPTTTEQLTYNTETTHKGNFVTKYCNKKKHISIIHCVYVTSLIMFSFLWCLVQTGSAELALTHISHVHTKFHSGFFLDTLTQILNLIL